MTEVMDHTHTFVSVCVRSLVTVARKSALKSLTIRLHASLQAASHTRGKDSKEKVVHSSFIVKTEDEICAERQPGECKCNVADSLYASPS